MDNKDEKKSEKQSEKEMEELDREVVVETKDDEKKLEEMEAKYKRALADYQNLQRRTQEQKIEWIKSANRELLLKLLPVLDTLMLANKHINDKGLYITIDQFLKILEQEGLQRIKTIGEQFNPHAMEAITTKEGQEGKVLEEVRPGFMLNESVLRSAQVIVGKGK
jgi:molecular chaperone GrpE